MYRRPRLKRSVKYRPRRGIKLDRQSTNAPRLPTRSGVQVRSRYEQTCANILTAGQIRFDYEPLLLLAGRQYRPDFFLPDYRLFLEICGFDHMPFYRDRIAEKEAVFQRHGLQVVFVHYRGKGSLECILRQALQQHGVAI